jgi:branched-chain amino acid transport system ATP-binding protein
MAEPLLQATAVECAYGASTVLFGVYLAVGAGEVVGLLGRDGMGKTTFIRTLMGLKAARAGEIGFASQLVSGWSPGRIGRIGLALVPEGRQVFANRSVDEYLTALRARRNGHAHGAAWDSRRVYELFPRLAERKRNLGSQLSGGEQTMLAIGRAMVTNPKMMILDGVTEGLTPLIREEVWHCLRQLRAEGLTLIVVDKCVNRLVEIADHRLILERRRVAWRGSSAQLQADPTVWHRYFGV